MRRAKLRSSDASVLGATAVVLAAALPTGLSDAFADSTARLTFIAFALLVFASEMLEVNVAKDIRYSPGLAPALAYALLGDHSIAQTLAVFALGVAAATVVRAGSREAMQVVDSAVHVLALGGAVVVHAAISRVPAFTFRPEGGNFAGLLLTPVAVLLLVIAITTVLRAVRHVQTERVPFAPVFADTLRATAALHVATISVAALLALSYPALRYWSFPLFLAPLWATQFAYRQFASIKKTYLQTIRALSRVPELAGYTAQGHSERVAELAVAVAREMAVPEHEATEIEYAALLHDIGRLSLVEPDDVVEDPHELALTGANIVRETGHFPHVAEMIEKQHVAYRRRGEHTDRTLSVGARAIKVASAYDDFTNPGGIGLSPRDALEKLYRDMQYEYDPDVVKALIRVLEKRGVL